jgi:hypothetical protein
VVNRFQLLQRCFRLVVGVLLFLLLLARWRRQLVLFYRRQQCLHFHFGFQLGFQSLVELTALSIEVQKKLHQLQVLQAPIL